MKLFFKTLLLASALASSASASLVLAINEDIPRNPGATFVWTFTVSNDSGYWLWPTGVDSTFPSTGSINASDPPVTEMLDDFFLAYPDGLPNGATSTLLPLAGYDIDASAPGGSQVGTSGVGPCCTLILNYDLYDDLGAWSGSGYVESGFTAVTVAGSPGPTPVPEPPSGATAGLTALLGTGYATARRRRHLMRGGPAQHSLPPVCMPEASSILAAVRNRIVWLFC